MAEPAIKCDRLISDVRCGRDATCKIRVGAFQDAFACDEHKEDYPVHYRITSDDKKGQTLKRNSFYQALNNIRRVYGTESYLQVYGQESAGHGLLEIDRDTVIHQTLNHTLPDDGEPITPGWLANQPAANTDLRTGLSIGIDSAGIVAIIDEANDVVVELPGVTTRGEFRQLCRFLSHGWRCVDADAKEKNVRRAPPAKMITLHGWQDGRVLDVNAAHVTFTLDYIDGDGQKYGTEVELVSGKGLRVRETQAQLREMLG